MKTIIKLVFILLIATSISSCSGDDEGIGSIIDDDGPVEELGIAVKIEDNFNLNENDGPRDVAILFDNPALVAGEIKIRLHLQAGLELKTIPEAIENIISLDIEEGDEAVSFNIDPIDDNIIKGMKNLSVTFHALSEGFRKAHNNGLSITIVDDELKGKPKSMNNGAVTYTYREDGKIKKVTYIGEWHNYTHNYIYSETGQISAIVPDNSWETYQTFIWEESKVVRLENRLENNLFAYSLFEYDNNGNIKEELQYTKQANGEFGVHLKYEYEYFPDGNLHKIYMFSPLNDKSEYGLGGTYTYAEYSEKINPWPLNEIIPTIPVHKNLYGYYKGEDGWGTVVSPITYEFNSEGKPVKQISNVGVSVTFEYY